MHSLRARNVSGNYFQNVFGGTGYYKLYRKFKAFLTGKNSGDHQAKRRNEEKT
jgi:hypothetical protein